MHGLPNNSDDQPSGPKDRTFWENVRDCVIRAREGDKAAFDLLYQMLWEMSVGFVRKNFSHVLSATDPEDIAQHAFVTAWRKLHTLRNVEAFPRWFFTILSRKSLAAYRIAISHSIISRHPDDFEISSFLVPELAKLVEEEESGGATPFGILVRREVVTAATKRVQKVYGSLTQKQKAVFTAHFVNLFNETETARSTGIAVGTVRTHIRRIRELLQRDLKSCELSDVPVNELRLAITEVFARWSSI